MERLRAFERFTVGPGGHVMWAFLAMMLVIMGCNMTLLEHFQLLQLESEYGTSRKFMGTLTLEGTRNTTAATN